MVEGRRKRLDEESSSSQTRRERETDQTGGHSEEPETIN